MSNVTLVRNYWGNCDSQIFFLRLKMPLLVGYDILKSWVEKKTESGFSNEVVQKSLEQIIGRYAEKGWNEWLLYSDTDREWKTHNTYLLSAPGISSYRRFYDFALQDSWTNDICVYEISIPAYLKYYPMDTSSSFRLAVSWILKQFYSFSLWYFLL